MGYAKLFSSIIHSTIWREPPHVKILWITMLAMSDKDGAVMASVPGLADAARVTIEQCNSGLQRLQEPDPYSRTKENDGRRITEIDGGWALLNYPKYRDLKSEEEIKEKNRVKVANWRQKQKDNVTKPVTQSNSSDARLPSVSHLLPPTDIDTDKERIGEVSPKTPLPLPAVLKVRKRRSREEILEGFGQPTKNVLNALAHQWRTEDPCDGRKIVFSPQEAGENIQTILSSQPNITDQTLIQSGQNYCRQDRQRYKAMQHYFGPLGPWKGYVQDILTRSQSAPSLVEI